MIAAIVETSDLERLYTALSLLVSTAAEGRPARALLGFGALEPMLADDVAAQVEGRDAFARSLTELRAAASELEDCRLYACAAAVETTGADRAAIDARLDGVRSMPRFLREVEGAELVFV